MGCGGSQEAAAQPKSTAAARTTSGSKSADSAAATLVWDPKGKAVAQGSNKYVYSGTFNSEKIVVCYARTTEPVDIERAKNEIEALNKLKHPSIIRMLSSGEFQNKPYLALEVVQPIGFDLDRLWSQYELQGTKVPASLCGSLFRQMVEGMQHMHSKKLLHLDLKTQNVLVTLEHNAKICDFGIATKTGQPRRLVSGYMSPELCNGGVLGEPADCWGLGLILHQMYQGGQWNLTDCSQTPARLRAGCPLIRSRMPQEVQEVMVGLIKDQPSQRLTLTALKKTKWLSTKETKEDWLKIPEPPQEPSDWLAPYQGSSRPLTLSILIGSEQTHLFGKRLGDVGLSDWCQNDEHPISVLLVKEAAGKIVTQPTSDTKMAQGTRIYLGVPAQSEYSEQAVSKIEEIFFKIKSEANNQDSVKTSDVVLNHALHDNTKRKKQQVAQEGSMHSFAMEFDSFVFPKHIGHDATIGPLAAAGPGTGFADAKHIALDLKGKFNIHLAGVQRIGATDVEWFPGPHVRVNPGDHGLIARCPRSDGESSRAVKEDDLAKLLDEKQFGRRCQAAVGDGMSTSLATGVVVHAKFPSVRVYDKPSASESSRKVQGDIQNNTKVRVLQRTEEWVLVEVDNIKGWVGEKNVRPE